MAGPFSLWDIGGCNCTTPPTKICVTTCTSPSYPVVGATIQLYSGATLVDSCTTGSDGCCTFTESGTYTVKVIISGTTEFSGSRTLAGSPITISVTNPNVICCGGYAIPVSLTLTDAVGSLTFAYCSACSGTTPTWTGGHAVTLMSCTVSIIGGSSCVANTPTSGPVRVCYSMTCNAGSSPKFKLTRSWTEMYESDLTTPTYFQDATGFSPGSQCTTAPGAICASSPAGADGTANPTSSSPFAISFTLADFGSNLMPDPIGSGSVAIS